MRTYVAQTEQLKSKEKQIHSEDLNQHSVAINNQDVLNKQLEELNKHQNIHEDQLQQNTIDNMQTQSDCRYVECNSDIVDAYIQDSSYIQNGQPIQQGNLVPINNYNPPNSTIHVPLQISNYNISNVIYSTSYPITLQPLQPALMHNQVKTLM